MSKIVLYPADGYDFDAADVAAYLAGLTSGVFSSAEDFPVTAAGGLKVTVGAGRGWVHPSRFTGYSITKREADTLTLPLADPSLPRIDRIVMRYDAGARAASLQVLQGTASSTPTAPAISRTELIYDLCLAEITRPAGSTAVTTGQITDTRLDEKLCGIVRDGVTHIPTAELLATAKARIAELEETASDSSRKAAACMEEAAASAKAAADDRAAAGTHAANAKQALRDTTQARDDALQDINAACTEALDSVSKATLPAQEAAAKAGRKATEAADAAAATAQDKTAAGTSAEEAARSQSAAAKSAEEAKKAAGEAKAYVSTDPTLSTEGAPADAKATGDALAGKLSLSGGTMTGPLILLGGLAALGYANNAGNRNAMPPRDRSLGAPTTEHFEMIASDKYNELFLGDYWTVDGVDWVIGDFKFWYNTGDTNCTKPHVAAFPRNNLYTYKFNPTNTTEGGYVGSDLYKNGLTQAKQMVTAAFGSAHILNHREYLVNAVTNGAPTGTDWYDSTVELMNENMVYGSRQFSPMPDGATDPWSTCRNYTVDKSQLSLFRYEPWMICNRNWYWLRDVVSVTGFAHVHSFSTAHCSPASTVLGVRPVVGIC